MLLNARWIPDSKLPDIFIKVFFSSSAFKPLIMKWKQVDRRQRKTSHRDRRVATQKPSLFPSKNDGARTKQYFKYIIRKYAMLVKVNIKLHPLNFVLCFALEVFLRCTRPALQSLGRLPGLRLRKFRIKCSGRFLLSIACHLDAISWKTPHLPRRDALRINELIQTSSRLADSSSAKDLIKAQDIIIHESSASFIYHSSGEARHQILIIMEIYPRRKNKYKDWIHEIVPKLLDEVFFILSWKFTAFFYVFRWFRHRKRATQVINLIFECRGWILCHQFY